MDENKKSFLEVKDLEVGYTSGGKRVHAVEGVSLKLERGATLGLVGETGAGKTTIAKSIMRILPEPQGHIYNGEIWLDGQNVLELSEHDMRKIRGNECAMIFQDPMSALNPVMTVGSQIEEAVLEHSKCTREEAMKTVVDILETVGIPGERYGEYPHQFSGGMKQRVVIAMALVCNPNLLLADEPTTALDVTVQAQVLDLIKELQVKYQTAMILITHDLGIVAETCDTVAVIYAGRIVEYAEKMELFHHVMHPYTKGLFDSIPKMNDDSGRLNPIEGLPPDPTNLPTGCPFHPRCKYATEACMQGDIPLADVGNGHLCRCLRVNEVNS